MKIMWFSQHPPIAKQLVELKRLFGAVEVIQDPQPFSDADEVVKRYMASGADDMVVVAPLSVIEQLNKRGIIPLYAEMEPTSGPEYDVQAKGKKYIFKEFSRIEIKIAKHPVQSADNRFCKIISK